MSSDAWLWYAQRAPEETKLSQADSVTTFVMGAKPAPSGEKASDRPKGTATKQLDLAVYWLRRLLENGPIEVKTVESMAVKEGFSLRTLRRARDQLNLKPIRHDWKWYLRAGHYQSADRIELKRVKAETKAVSKKKLRDAIKQEKARRKETKRVLKIFGIKRV
jgi:hypothetical protein